MHTLIRDKERQHDHDRKQEAWHTFHSNSPSPVLTHGFGALEAFDENRLAPGTDGAQHPSHSDAEIITYVRDGVLAFEDSLGHSGVIHSGEFQRSTFGRGIRHRETNPSRTDWTHIFQIWLRPSGGELEPSHEQKRFSAAERRGVFCVVASPDARRGSIRIHPEPYYIRRCLTRGST